MTSRHLALLVQEDLLRRPLRGVYYASHLTDSLALRLECVRLVVPHNGVVTDRTAGWLHGADMVLAPGDHEVVPRVSVFQPPGLRLRNGLARSGSRMLSEDDVVDIDGIKVTTPVRTACDLGRLLRRDGAFAALDAMLSLGLFTHEQLLAQVERFKGFRGVRQLRAFAPLADGGSESFGESALRLRWYDACLPRPVTQIVVHDGAFTARLDLGLPELGYAAEYDGDRWHGPERAEHDRRRREHLRALGWRVLVFRRGDVFGPRQHADLTLRREFAAARLARDVHVRDVSAG
jgi:hypothetical protein